MMFNMKSIVRAAAMIAGLQAATASADIFSDTQKTAPLAIFADLDGTAPHADGFFGTLSQTAPRSQLFAEISHTVPRLTGILGSLRGNAN